MPRRVAVAARGEEAGEEGEEAVEEVDGVVEEVGAVGAGVMEMMAMGDNATAVAVDAPLVEGIERQHQLMPAQ